MKKLLITFYKIPKKIRKTILFVLNYFVISSGFIVLWEHFFPTRHIVVSLFILLSNILVIFLAGKILYRSSEFSIIPDVEKATENLNNHYDEMIQVLMSLAKETSERERINNQLYHQKALMYEIIDKLPGCYLAVKDASGKYTIVNRLFAELIGCDPWDVIGKTVAETPFKDRDIYLESDKCLLENGGVQITKEIIEDTWNNEIEIIKFKKRFRDGIMIFAINTEYICK